MSQFIIGILLDRYKNYIMLNLYMKVFLYLGTIGSNLKPAMKKIQIVL